MDFHQPHSQQNPDNVGAGQKFTAWIVWVVLCIFQNQHKLFFFFYPLEIPLDFWVFWKWVLMTSFWQLLGSSRVLTDFLMLECLISVAVVLSILTYLLFLHSRDSTRFYCRWCRTGVVNENPRKKSIANLCSVSIVYRQKSRANLSQNWGGVLINPLEVFPTGAQLCWLKLHPFLCHCYHLYTVPI